MTATGQALPSTGLGYNVLSSPAEIADAVRFLSRYAKDYFAGAFATPMTKDAQAGRAGEVRQWVTPPSAEHPGGTRTVAFLKRLSRTSTRRDFTGHGYAVGAGALVVTHIARTPGAPVPSIPDADALYIYAEDQGLTAAMAGEGRARLGVRISRSSEIIACYGRSDDEPMRYSADELATVVSIPLPALSDPAWRSAALAEVAGASGWTADAAYYNTGSWGSVSLRGFWPDDPARGAKPSELSVPWQREHPEDMRRTCGWTSAADLCPAITRLIKGTSWMSRLERARLVQLKGKTEGGKDGVLGRHADVVNLGTADGQVARLHVPLITDPRIHLLNWDIDGVERKHHFAPWQVWYLDARKPHAVVNPTGLDRVHLVVDVLAGPELRALIGASHIRSLGGGG